MQFVIGLILAHTQIVAATAKSFNNGIKFMSEPEVDPLSIKKAFLLDSDNDSDIDELPLNDLKKNTNSAKKSA